jgi:hypothetical protein
MSNVKAVWRVTLGTNNAWAVPNLSTAPLTVGQVYTTNGTGASIGWANNSNSVLTARNDPAELEVKGKLVLNGQDLEERLKTIEYVLGLPERDVTMESKYPSLKKKYDEYVKALAKYRTFEAIKGDDNGTT